MLLRIPIFVQEARNADRICNDNCREKGDIIRCADTVSLIVREVVERW